MRIDIHTHTSDTEGLTRTNGTRYPTPEEYIAMLDAARIDRAVVLSTMSPAVRYSYVTPQEVLRIHRRFPDRIIPFCSLDPRFLTNSPDADFRPMLTYFKEVGFRGVGEYIPNLPLDHELNLNLFRQVEEAGLPLTFHLAPKVGGYYGCVDELGLPRLERVLQEVPNLVFLAHSQVFWAEIGTDVREANRTGYPSGPVTPGRVVDSCGATRISTATCRRVAVSTRSPAIPSSDTAFSRSSKIASTSAPISPTSGSSCR